VGKSLSNNSKSDKAGGQATPSIEAPEKKLFPKLPPLKPATAAKKKAFARDVKKPHSSATPAQKGLKKGKCVMRRCQGRVGCLCACPKRPEAISEGHPAEGIRAIMA